MQILLGHVGIFFFVENEFLLHHCALGIAQPYGDFLNYPLSHDTVWEKFYRRKFGVDFDYYPRGRILFNKAAQIYLIYFDGCIEREIEKLSEGLGSARFHIARDEHYQCHRCNPEYTLIER